MRSSRAVLPLLMFLFGLVALGIAVFVTLRPAGQTGASGIGGPFRLTATDGRTVTEADLAGKVSLVFFGFTHCPDVCPTTLQDITLVYDALGKDGAGVQTFFVTVDPLRDTRDILADYLSSFDKKIVGLTGDETQTGAMVKAFRAYARRVPLDGGGYTMDHTALVYLMDRNGRFVGSLNLDKPAGEAAKDLRRYL